MEHKNIILSVFLVGLLIALSSLTEIEPKESGLVSSITKENKPSQKIVLDIRTPLEGSIGNVHDIRIQIFDKINECRKANNLTSLQWSLELEDAANIRAEEATRCWSHTRPDGTDYWTTCSALVYGENLATGFTTAEEVFEGWFQSPSHKENMLLPEFRYVAIGRCENTYSAEFCY